jgi:hypothetical protein
MKTDDYKKYEDGRLYRYGKVIEFFKNKKRKNFKKLLKTTTDSVYTLLVGVSSLIATLGFGFRAYQINNPGLILISAFSFIGSIYYFHLYFKILEKYEEEENNE